MQFHIKEDRVTSRESTYYYISSVPSGDVREPEVVNEAESEPKLEIVDESELNSKVVDESDPEPGWKSLLLRPL